MYLLNFFLLLLPEVLSDAKPTHFNSKGHLSEMAGALYVQGLFQGANYGKAHSKGVTLPKAPVQCFWTFL
jgi:hypothetical protein